MPRDKLIQPRKGTAADWSFVNPVLDEAEFGYETDTKKMKMGDGVSDWGTLAYISSWGAGGGGGTTWGSITGTLSSQTDLNSALNAKAPLASPTFTGTVTLPAGQAVNGVTLTTGGGTSNFLRADGTYAAPSASISWGGITGTLSSQTDLQTALNAKAPIASPTFTGTVSGITAAMVGAPSGSGTSSGTNTGDQTSVSGNAGTATALATGRTISISGDLTYTSPSFDGSGNVTAAGTLATVNSNVGSFGSATASPTYTVNGKGLITAAANVTITPDVGSITGLGTGVATALAVNTGSAGSVVLFNGALGTPSSGVATNLTGTASGLTAGTVTTNANLTGDVTSTGNATAIASGVIVNDDVNASAGILLSKTNISLTTTGSSGVSTLNTTTGVLNIPNYAGGGGESLGLINMVRLGATIG